MNSCWHSCQLGAIVAGTGGNAGFRGFRDGDFLTFFFFFAALLYFFTFAFSTQGAGGEDLISFTVGFGGTGATEAAAVAFGMYGSHGIS